MKNYKRAKIIIPIIICVVALAIFGGFLGAGAYSYAQQYDFNTNEENLIKIIKEFKNNDLQYKVPGTIDLTDSADSTNGYYHAYVYFSKENKIIHFFVCNDPDNLNKSSIYLDAVNEGVYLGNWKVINRDYNRNENLKVKKAFEEKILNQLKLPYKNKGNGMFIFWK